MVSFSTLAANFTIKILTITCRLPSRIRSTVSKPHTLRRPAQEILSKALIITLKDHLPRLPAQGQQGAGLRRDGKEQSWTKTEYLVGAQQVS